VIAFDGGPLYVSLYFLSLFLYLEAFPVSGLTGVSQLPYFSYAYCREALRPGAQTSLRDKKDIRRPNIARRVMLQQIFTGLEEDVLKWERFARDNPASYR
jgi:hypothetical protein